jgi:hypothetical protein
LSNTGITDACRKANARARSRISNGSNILPGIDGRSVWVRRFRDLQKLHLSDLGGEDRASEAEKSIIRRAATITTELEYFELRFALAHQAGETPDIAYLELYQRLANSLRRLLEAVGVQRRPRDVTLPLKDYLASTPSADAQEVGE